MEDHRMETYKRVQTGKTVKAFQGQGYTLGSPAPSVVSALPNEDKTGNEQKAKENLQVDTSIPTTK